ncbi:hypothetical protein LAZ67_3003459 [Cordylochernes scorpioides]|uniref:Transposase Tc1-like domain-containing protein n=1 Tax=Cordylochernes scorpioides TaxID=51811 RepID=A0ABY6K8S5_9ARAC|nr:hypothetical protein LAZ67_3003459 [Cordylochernes scorpioides]
MPGHRKRRQFKQTEAFTRGMVIGLKRAGWSIRQIAADTHLGASTVHRLWRRWLEQGNVAIYRNVGATRVTSARVDRRILRQAVAAPQATCTAILQHVQDTLDHSISTRTISRRLVANGLHSCRPLRRLPLTPPNRRQRLEWCRARSTWMTEWHRVVFSEESNPAAIVERPTVRQRGIMVWGAIAYDSRSHLLRIQDTMTAQRYVDDVLRPVTLPYLQGMLPWPPYSPDLSPIEHVWDIIGRRLHALPQPRSEDELWQMVEREWRAIPQDAIRTLIDSLPRRVAACIAVRVRAESPLKADQMPGRHSNEELPCAEKSAIFNSQRNISNTNERIETHANSPAGGRNVNSAAPFNLAAISSSNRGADAQRNWADYAEDVNSEEDDSFTVVKGRKRRRDSPDLPVIAAQSNSAGTSRRQRPSTGRMPQVQEIRTTRAHVMEARARQASCTEEQCCFLEYCPEYQTYQYMKAMEKVVGSTRNIVQFTKVNGQYLVGLANRSLAERLVREGLEIEGTLLKTFPFRRTSIRITIGNLPFFVGDAAVMDALSRYGRITSIAPKQLRVGEFDFTDGRREAFILLHDGITVEMLPARFEIKIKGEPWPAFLTFGIKCSKCRGQGHRRANCPQLHGRPTTSRRASPPPSTSLPPSTAPGLPRRTSAAPPAPALPSPAMEVCSAPPVARAVLHPLAPRPSPPEAPALPLEETPSTPPPVTPAPSLQAPEVPVGPRPAKSQHPEPMPPARPDFVAPRDPLPTQETLGPAAPTPDVEMSIVEETTASSTSSTRNATGDDLVAFIEGNPSVSFARTDALGREEVLDLLSSRTRAKKRGPLLPPPQSDALAGLISQILDLKPGMTSNLYKVLGQVRAELAKTPAAVPTPPLPAPRPAGPTPSAPHKEESTPAMTPPSPLPAPMEEDLPPYLEDWIFKNFREVLSSQPDLVALVESEISWTDVINAILHSQSRAPFLARLSPDFKKHYAVFFEAVFERARDCHPRILSGLSELIKALTPKTRRPRGKRST